MSQERWWFHQPCRLSHVPPHSTRICLLFSTNTSLLGASTTFLTTSAGEVAHSPKESPMSPGTETDLLCVNGINGATGDYLLPQLSADQIAAVAKGEKLDPLLARELAWRTERARAAVFGLIEGVDPAKLEETGWGVIFAANTDPAVLEALRPPLEHRR